MRARLNRKKKQVEAYDPVTKKWYRLHYYIEGEARYYGDMIKITETSELPTISNRVDK